MLLASCAGEVLFLPSFAFWFRPPGRFDLAVLACGPTVHATMTTTKPNWPSLFPAASVLERFVLLAAGVFFTTGHRADALTRFVRFLCPVGGGLSRPQVRARRGPPRRFLPGAGPDCSCGCFRGPSSMKHSRHRSRLEHETSSRSLLEVRPRPLRRPGVRTCRRACCCRRRQSTLHAVTATLTITFSSEDFGVV